MAQYKSRLRQGDGWKMPIARGCLADRRRSSKSGNRTAKRVAGYPEDYVKVVRDRPLSTSRSRTDDR